MTPTWTRAMDDLLVLNDKFFESARTYYVSFAFIGAMDHRPTRQGKMTDSHNLGGSAYNLLNKFREAKRGKTKQSCMDQTCSDRPIEGRVKQMEEKKQSRTIRGPYRRRSSSRCQSNS